MAGYDFAATEAKWQRRWEEARLFEPAPGKGKKFFLTVPYPYTSGPQHIGHGRTYTVGDVFARYRRMTGHNVLWPMAFHITGTPVLAIANQIKAGDRKTLELYRDYLRIHEKDEKKIDEILKSFTEPANVAKYFAETYIHDFKSIGFSIDWRRRFTTGDPDYNAFITWQFQKFKEAGLLAKGSYPVLYCVRDENAVGEDDIKDGDRIKADVVTFTALKYPFEDGFLVPATFRPETVFGVTNLWVNPKADYVKAKVDGEIWYVSKQASEKLKRQDKKVEVVAALKGKELIGKKAKGIVDSRELPVLAADFVDPDNATGVVYSVPAHAPYDYAALKDAGLLEKVGMISMITVPGFGEHPAKELCERLGVKSQLDAAKLEQATDELYKAEFYKGVLKKNCGEFAGKGVAQAKDAIVAMLRKRNAASDVYEVAALQKPVKCRCGGDVVVAVLKDQWFLHYGDAGWKQKSRDCLAKMTIYPETYRKSFEATFDWLDRRPCARRRGLGTELPFQKGWIIESLSDSTIYMAFYTVKAKISEFGLKPQQLTYDFWDYVFLGNGNGKEVAKKTGVPEQQLDATRKEFLYWYPNDHRHTAVAHISNHLSFFIFAHTAIFPPEHWPKAITLNELLISEGAKMSKSKGNVIPLADVSRRYSADLYRLYVTHTADLNSAVDWREKDVADVRGKLLRFHETVSQMGNAKMEGLSAIDRWMLSRINRTVMKATAAIEGYRTREYAQTAFFDVLNDLGHYSKRAARRNPGVEYYVAERWLRLMAPITPHICEELWEALGNKPFASTAQWPQADEKEIDAKVEAGEDIVIGLADDIRHVLEFTKIKPKRLTMFVAPGWKRGLYEKVGKIKNPATLMKEAMQDPEVRKQGKEAASYVQHLARHSGALLPEILSEAEELKTLSEAAGFLEKEFGAKVVVEAAEKSQNAKAKNAIPHKPAIFAE